MNALAGWSVGGLSVWHDSDTRQEELEPELSNVRYICSRL